MSISAPPPAPPQLRPASGSGLVPPRQNPALQRQRAAKAAGSSNARASARLAAALARSRAWARPAGTGARLGAFSVDLLFVLLAAAATGLLLRSILLGVLVGLELAVILAILESRTGVTLGNLLFRLRTVRDDAPFSSGVARGAVRSLVLGVGSLCALVGGWIVVATSAGDPMRMGRSLADRAGHTLVVRVPTAAERAEWARGAERWAVNTRTAPSQQPLPQQAMLQQGGAQPQAPQSPPPALVAPGEAPPQQPQTQQPQASMQPQPQIQQPRVAQMPQPHQSPAAVAANQPQLVRPPRPASGPNTGTAPQRAAHGTHGAQLPVGVVPVDAPIAPPPPVRDVEIGEQLLLTFDTGQRAQLPIPVTVNLGRRPERAEAEDQLLVVQDAENSVSKTHLRLDYRGESVWVTDLGSTNGSEIFDDTGEGALLSRGMRVRLDDGSRVRIGSRSFTVATVQGEVRRHAN